MTGVMANFFSRERGCLQNTTRNNFGPRPVVLVLREPEDDGALLFLGRLLALSLIHI